MPEPDPGILVTRKPLDIAGATSLIDAGARAEAIARTIRKSKSNRSPRHSTQRSYAKAFDEVRYSVRSYVPNDEGDGYWDIYRVSDAIFVMIGKCRYQKSKWLSVPGEHCFKIRFLRSGLLLKKSGEPFLKSPNTMFELYPSHAGDGYFIAAGIPCCIAVIYCANSVLTQQLGIDPASAPMPLSLLADATHTTPYAFTFEPPAIMSRAFGEMLDIRDHYESNLRGWFVEVKAREIIAAMLHSMLREPELEIGANRLRRTDRQRVLEAREIILANIDNIPTIPELARMVGINQTKLKAGFKAIIGSTIGEFVARSQMDLAAYMLTSTDLNISQISQSLGYRHSSNFTQAFKRYFGRVPREYRQSVGLPECTPRR